MNTNPNTILIIGILIIFMIFVLLGYWGYTMAMSDYHKCIAEVGNTAFIQACENMKPAPWLGVIE
jgi:uncharacterized protein YpmB